MPDKSHLHANLRAINPEERYAGKKNSLHAIHGQREAATIVGLSWKHSDNKTLSADEMVSALTERESQATRMFNSHLYQRLEQKLVALVEHFLQKECVVFFVGYGERVQLRQQPHGYRVRIFIPNLLHEIPCIAYKINKFKK
jgi:hypothetical protein